MSLRVVGFGDGYGLPQLQRHMPAGALVALVGAVIRPQYLAQLQELADALDIPFLVQPLRTSPNYPQFTTTLAALEPDLIMVNSYSMKLHPDVLAIPRRGGVNVHGALLPEYRGSNPIQWALLNNEPETGVTLHYMDANFDTGDIIAQRRVPIFLADTWRDVQARVLTTAEDLLAEELPGLLSGTNSRVPQDESRAHYYGRRRPEDGHIDWQASVLQIYNLVRALVKPHPGAFYLDGPQRVVLDEYLVVPQIARLKYGFIGGQTLKLSHIFLRPLQPQDFSSLLDSDYWTPYFLKELLDSQENCSDEDRFVTILQQNDIALFGIHLLEGQEIIGLGRLSHIDYSDQTTRVKVLFREAAKVEFKHIQEALRLLLKYAFEELQLQNIYLDVRESDAAIMQVGATLGFGRKATLARSD